MIQMRTFAKPIASALLGCAALVTASTALAQSYPIKPIRFIVASSPGTSVDVLARLFGAEMGKALGQTIIVENKVGAAQALALEHVARQSPADGYTVSIIGTDAIALLPVTSKNLRFDPIKEITLIAGLTEARYIFAGSSSRPWKNFQELIAHAKANPGKLNYGASAHQVRFPILVLAQNLGIEMVHIPFSGGGPYQQAVAGGTVDVGMIGESPSRSMGDKINIFALTGDKRAPNLPNVPTFAELGFPQIRGPAYGMAVRTGTPREIVDRLTSLASTVMSNAAMQAGADKMLMVITNDKIDMAQKKLAEQVAFYADFAKKAGVTPE